MHNTYSSTVSLDASGFADDQYRTYNIRCPVAGTVFDDNTVQLTPHALRGDSDIRDVVINEFSVGFTLWAQLAADGLFGHRSRHFGRRHIPILSTRRTRCLLTNSGRSEPRLRRHDIDAEAGRSQR